MVSNNFCILIHIFFILIALKVNSFLLNKRNCNYNYKYKHQSQSILHVAQQQLSNKLYRNNSYQSIRIDQPNYMYDNIFDLIKVREIRNSNELVTACKFCVKAFFGETKSIFHYLMTNRIFNHVKQLSLDRYYNTNPSKSMNSFIVAEDNNNFIGFVQLSVVTVNENVDLFQFQPLISAYYDKYITRSIYLPKITNLSVNPKYRNQGIGTKLLQEAIHKAKEWGYDQVILEVEEDNITAIKLYTKLGFIKVYNNDLEIFDTSGIFLKITHKPGIVMTKILSDQS